MLQLTAGICQRLNFAMILHSEITLPDSEFTVQFVSISRFESQTRPWNRPSIQYYAIISDGRFKCIAVIAKNLNNLMDYCIIERLSVVLVERISWSPRLTSAGRRNHLVSTINFVILSTY